MKNSVVKKRRNAAAISWRKIKKEQDKGKDEMRERQSSSSLFIRASTLRKRRWGGWEPLLMTGKTPEGWRAHTVRWHGEVGQLKELLAEKDRRVSEEKSTYWSLRQRLGQVSGVESSRTTRRRMRKIQRLTEENIQVFCWAHPPSSSLQTPNRLLFSFQLLKMEAKKTSFWSWDCPSFLYF